jgi:predicted NACHT family NTPase
VVSPRHRQLYRYTQSFLKALDSALASKVAPTDLSELVQKSEKGLVLLGNRGAGKTTRLQMLAAHWARMFLDNPTAKVPILFPLTRWLPDRSLEDAIFEHVNSFGSVGRRSFRKTLKYGQAVVILDGADEIFMPSSPNFYPTFSNNFPKVRAAYTAVTWDSKLASGHACTC